ncbi:MAG: DNA polymerase beta [Gallionellales bacterium GWA2_59_43]|nr:MAG: DNA polymerase beta [Gallionellales bacterium GWA2_59_43]
MRLTPVQIAAIRRTTAEIFGDQASVWLFGSRVDDSKRGGDIDLLICPGQAPAGSVLARKITFLGRLERLLGERKVDVVIEEPGDTRPIVQVAHRTGIRL